ncbi:MAG: glycosyltransferase family 2 protein [Gemmataceae bacterium]|nr:glycosyltransferase family 2 protein [Gemmataceae bacterium]
MPEPDRPVIAATATRAEAPQLRAAALRRRRGRAHKPAWLQGFADDGPIDVSVCIANWNCRDMLRACLESLHDQPQGVHVETIVVDNGSSDGAADMVSREFPEVLLLRNTDNCGFSTANNQAASRARGRYLFFLNNDTVVPAGTLGRLVDYAEAHPEVGIVGPRLRDAEGHTQVSYRRLPTVGALLHRTSLLRWTGLCRRAYRRYRRHHFDASATRPVEVLMGAALLVPRHVFTNCGSWNEEYAFGGEDIEFSARIGRRYPLIYHPQVEITHYGRVSTRLNVAYSMPNVAVGFVRYLRQSGTSRVALFLYKAVSTLDAPVHLAIKGFQYLLRRVGRRPAEAAKSLLAARAAWYFLTRGLVTFWKA